MSRFANSSGESNWGLPWLGLIMAGLLALASACAVESMPPPATLVKDSPNMSPHTPVESLTLRLNLSSTSISFADRAAFQVGFIVENHTGRAVDPGLDGLRLAVNGEDSMSWNLALLNGARGPTWTMLPSGESIEMSWPLGEALFPAPGEYILSLKAVDRELGSSIVHVQE